MQIAHLICPEVQLLCNQRDQLRLGEGHEVNELVDSAKEFVSPKVPLEDRLDDAVLELPRNDHTVP